MSDVLRRVTELLPGLTPSAAARIEAEVRKDWGGDRPYIAKLGEVGRVMQSGRDEQIRHDSRKGAHPKLLARRYGISTRRIRQILASP